MKNMTIPHEKYLEVYRAMYEAKQLDAVVWNERMLPPGQSRSACIVVTSWWEWAIGAGVAAALDPLVDYLVPAHRSSAALANFFQRCGRNFAEPFLQNHFGSRDAPSRGQVLLIYFSFPELHIFPFHSDMGGNAPAAAGIGLALKRLHAISKDAQKKQGVVALFFGEGASNQGVVHEALSFIGMHNLPVLVIINHNNWSTYTPSEEEASVSDLSDRAIGYGLAKLQIQPGFDALMIYREVRELVERARREATREKTPHDTKAGALVVVRAERGSPHNVQMDLRPSFHTYNYGQVWAENLGRDPVEHLRRQLMSLPSEKALQASLGDVRKVFSLAKEDCEFSEEELLAAEEEIDKRIGETRERVLASPRVDVASCRRTNLFLPSSFTSVVLQGTKRDIEPVDSFWKGRLDRNEARRRGWTTRFVDARRAVMDREFELNHLLHAWGEDYGQGDVIGQWRAAPPDRRTLQEKYGTERIFNSILAEGAIFGSAEGAAFVGLRPVVGAQYLQYAFAGCSPLVSGLSPRWQLYGVSSPLTIILPSAEGISAGHHHGALHFKTLLYHLQMIKMVEPSTVRDMVGLFRAALRDNAPVVVVEGIAAHDNVYGAMPDDDNFIVPIGKAAVRQEGSDLTVLSWGAFATWMVAQPIVEELSVEGVGVEWIDARTLVPFDYSCVIDSVKKTNRLVVIHAEGLTGGIGESVVAKLAMYSDLEYRWNPVRMRVVAAADGATPQARELEADYLPSVARARTACYELLGNAGGVLCA